MPAAFTCYQAALQLRPNFPQGLNNLAVIFTAQGRAQDALQMLQAAIAAAPDYAEAYNNLGVLQREVGAIKASLYPAPGSAGRSPGYFWPVPSLCRAVGCAADAVVAHCSCA